MFFFLAVHWSRIEGVLNQTGDLSGKVIVTCSLPINDDNTELVVAAFNWAQRSAFRRLRSPSASQRTESDALRRRREQQRCVR